MKNFANNVFSVFREKRLSTIAGAWVYYFLMSVIPLAFLLATAFGVFGINVLNDLVSRLPQEFRATGLAIKDAADNVSRSATLLFIITVILSCTTLLNQMSKDGDFIYGVQGETKHGFMRHFRAVIALSALFTVFMAMALLVAFRSKILPQAIENQWSRLLFSVVAVLTFVLFCYAIIIALFKYISPVKQKIKEFMLGGLCSLAIIVIGTLGFALYLRFFGRYNALYGSLAGIVVFLIWAYIVMLGLAVGVVINKCAYERAKNKAELKEENAEEKEQLTPNKKTRKKSVTHA